ncbi:cytochrome P450 [Coprinopsis marcescibilis]|uniref:Cytochrome P450 n=1 Tax=Coprinopsis marcescibilis TaxID=230819 RepID=A0A5C3KJM3_COPMA|nr:cytochrome P450 [Coprinopsis marcescibilis]
MDPTTILGDSQWKWPIAAGLALGMYTVSKSAAKKRSPLPLPPGPKGLPIVGNVLQIPQTKPWLVYNEWAKQYGDVIYIEALGQGMVVLNTLSAAQGLLDKRSVTTSDRGYPPCFEIMNFDWAFALMPYGADWRTHRRVFHQSLNANEAPNYLPAIEKDCLAYLRNLADSPEKLFDHVRT